MYPGKNHNSDDLSLDGLLQRMRNGDREAAAVFITHYGSRIRRRIRGKLAPAMRRVFDSQDILSTLGRRLDVFVRAGRLEAASERQLWALIFRMAENAVVDKSRVFNRIQKGEGEHTGLAQDLLRRLREAEEQSDEALEGEIEHAFRALSDPMDRQILSLWLVGMPHSEIAEMVNLEPATVRKRWQRIRDLLRERLDTGSPNE